MFFIIKTFTQREQIREPQYKIFLKDSTLTQRNLQNLKLQSNGLKRIYWVCEYTPRYNQRCYSNSFNPFVVNKSIRDLLIEAKDLNKKRGAVNFKTISVDKKYDSHLKLVSFQGHYIIFNHGTKAPFRFKLFIKREPGSYSIRGEIETYYFWGQPNLNMGKLDVHIFPNASHNSFIESTQLKKLSNKYITANILPKNVLASSLNNLQNPNYFNYNQTWFRELNLPKDFVMEKGKFNIVISWKMGWDNSKSWSGSMT